MKRDVILSYLAVVLGCMCVIFTIWFTKPAISQKVPLQSIEEDKIPFDYLEILAKAKQQGKHIFLFFGADWCKWCKKMEIDTLSKPKTKKALSQYLVYYVDINKENAIAAKYQLQFVPMYLIINSEEEILKKGSGYKGEAAFLLWLNTKIGGFLPPRDEKTRSRKQSII